MYDLGQRISEYTEELYSDLGLSDLPEEKKADLFARIEEHFHQTILGTLRNLITASHLAAIKTALVEENYEKVGNIVGRYPKLKTLLENKIEEESAKLKLIITEEQKDARQQPVNT